MKELVYRMRPELREAIKLLPALDKLRTAMAMSVNDIFERFTEDEKSWLVEGFFDCLKVHQSGIRSVVALMGAVLYRSPERALTERFRQLVLMLDGDATGREASRIIANRLRRHCAVRVVELPANVQPDQLSAEMIRETLGGALA